MRTETRNKEQNSTRRAALNSCAAGVAPRAAAAFTAAARMLLSAATALVLLAACTNELTDPLGTAPATTPDGRKLVTVNITRPEAEATTRLAFEDLGYTDPTDPATDQGLKLTWTTGDRLGVYSYNTDAFIGSLDLQPASNGAVSGAFAFSPASGKTAADFNPENDSYAVFYPYIEGAVTASDWNTAMQLRLSLPQTQNAAKPLDHLAAACSMSGQNLNPAAPTTFALEHERAVMTIKMEKPAAAAADELPVLLNFTDGTTPYTLGLEGWNDWTTNAAHLIIKGVVSSMRALRFEVVTNKGNVYSLTKNGVSKAYSSGRRYTALLTATAGTALTLDVAVTADMSKPLASYGSGMTLPTSNVWVVSDAFTAASDFVGLKAAIGVAEVTGRKITLVMPQGTGIANFAFQYCRKLVAVYMPAVQTIGNDAFFGCAALASVSMPSVETIDEWGFSDCTALTSVSMPSVKTVGLQALSMCTALASVSMPSVEIVGYYAFKGSTALTRFEIATAAGHTGLTAFGDNGNDVFEDVEISQVDLILGAVEYGKVTGSGTAATWRPAYDPSVGSTTIGYGPFKSIANGQK